MVNSQQSMPLSMELHVVSACSISGVRLDFNSTWLLYPGSWVTTRALRNFNAEELNLDTKLNIAPRSWQGSIGLKPAQLKALCAILQALLLFKKLLSSATD